MATYKNGRVAAVGDSVVRKEYSGLAEAGIVTRICPHSETCDINVLVAGERLPLSWTAAECLHIDDAMLGGTPSIYSAPPGETAAAPSQVECPVAEAAPPHGGPVNEAGNPVAETTAEAPAEPPTNV